MAVDLADRIWALPAVQRLVPALEGLPPAWLVGGAVRDLMLGASSVDLDVAIEGDAREVACMVAERLDGEVREHPRFGTATVRAPEVVVDLASTRRETYARPGALPDVEAATLADDLARRDFTVNAMAASLEQRRLGQVVDLHGGRADLDARVIRVLHPRSFSDDPTRLLRAVRYESRLGFRMDHETEQLARAAAGADALATVSGPRIRDELLDMLRERPATGGHNSPPAPAEAVARMRELGLDRALSPLLGDARPEEVGAAAEAGERVGAKRELAALAELVAPDPDGLADWVDSLSLRAEDRDAVLHAAHKGPQLVRSLEVALPDSAVHALLHCELPETLAVALALGAPEAPIRRYLEQLQGAGLEIDGDDLRAAGIPEGPTIGRALRETLKRKLDGEVSGHDAELELALSIAREEA